MVEEQVAKDVREGTPIRDEKSKEIKENGSTEEEKPAGDDKPMEDESDDKLKDRAEDGDEDDGESSEEELGLLEKPVEILTSKRVRKSIEVYGDKKPEELEKNKEELDYSKGKGVKLGDIPIVFHNVNRADTEDLQVLHRMMYGRVGKKHNTKKNIRAFCGWPFEKDSKEYKSRKSNIIDRLLKTALKWTLDLLAIEKSEDTEEMRDALCEFLMTPEMKDTEPRSRKSEGGSKRKSSGKKSTPKRKSTPKSKSKDKVNISDDEVSDVNEASDDNESDNEDKEEEEKPKNTPLSKKAVKKSKATPVKIAIPAKKRSAAKKRKSAASDESSEDEGPLAKKTNTPPTDVELKKVVSGILKNADLEQVTMKSVVKQVYDKYSSFDLSSRKDYIKSTVKELIS